MNILIGNRNPVKNKKVYTIGYLTVKLDNGYQGLLWQGINEAAADSNIELITFAGYSVGSPHNFDLYHNAVYDFIPKIHLDGLIIASGALGGYCGIEILEKYIKEISGNLPIVTIAAKIGEHPLIYSDCKTAVKEAICHLVTCHGCTNFAHITGPATNPESMERTNIFNQTLNELGLNLNPQLVENGHFYYLLAKAASLRLLDKNIPFDAIFASNDESALGFIDACEERSIKIPQDIKVVGVDNSSNGKYKIPSLSSIDTQISVQGATAVNTLLQLIKGKHQNDIAIPSMFIKRASCGCNLSKPDLKRTITIPKGVSLSRQFLDTALSILQTRPDITTSIVHKKYMESFTNQIISSLCDVSISGPYECLTILNDFFEHYKNSESNTNLLQKLIIAFQEIIFTRLDNAKNSKEFNRINHIRILIDNLNLYCNIKLEHCYAERFLTFEHYTLNMQKLNQHILLSQTYADLYMALVQELPSLNIYNFFLLRNQKSLERDGLHFRIDNFQEGIYILNGVHHNITTTIDSFYTILQKHKTQGWVILPLIYRDEQLGFIGIGLKNDMDVLSERLSIIISGMLKSIQIFNEKRNGEKRLLDTTKLVYTPNIDEFTGLYNRRGFLKHAENLISSAIRTEDDILVIYADLVNLHLVIDTLGDAEGDKMIHEVSDIFSRIFHQIGIVGRMSENEFAITCKIKKEEDTVNYISQLNEIINNINNSNTQNQWKISISFGSCTMNRTGIKSISELLRFTEIHNVK